MVDDPDVEVAALGALYTSERADLTALMGHSMNLVNVTVVYLGAAATVWATVGDNLPSAIVALAPAPAVTALMYHSLLAALVFFRTQSTKEIEKELVRKTGVADQGSILGVTGGDLVMNPAEAMKSRDRWGFAATTFLCYLAMVLIVAGFVIACLVSASDESLAIALVAGAVYTLLFLVFSYTWYGASRVSPENRKQWAPPSTTSS